MRCRLRGRRRRVVHGPGGTWGVGRAARAVSPVARVSPPLVRIVGHAERRGGLAPLASRHAAHAGRLRCTALILRRPGRAFKRFAASSTPSSRSPRHFEAGPRRHWAGNDYGRSSHGKKTGKTSPDWKKNLPRVTWAEPPIDCFVLRCSMGGAAIDLVSAIRRRSATRLPSRGTGLRGAAAAEPGSGPRRDPRTRLRHQTEIGFRFGSRSPQREARDAGCARERGA